MEIGRRIRDRRKELHMTQRQLAERVFVTTQAVSQWETGATRPDVFNLRAIAAALDLPEMTLVSDFLEEGAGRSSFCEHACMERIPFLPEGKIKAARPNPQGENLLIRSA